MTLHTRRQDGTSRSHRSCDQRTRQAVRRRWDRLGSDGTGFFSSKRLLLCCMLTKARDGERAPGECYVRRAPNLVSCTNAERSKFDLHNPVSTALSPRCLSLCEALLPPLCGGRRLLQPLTSGPTSALRSVPQPVRSLHFESAPDLRSSHSTKQYRIRIIKIVHYR